MEALNAASLTPISVLFDRKQEPRKNPSTSIISLPTISISANFNINPQTSKDCLSRRFQGGLVFLSSIFNIGLAKALTYEEALQQSTSTSNEGDFDAGGLVGFVTENPAIVAGGALLLAVPLILSQFLKKPKPWGFESAKSAYAKLDEDDNAQLLDIRATVEFRQAGTPDISGLGKKPLSIVYRGEDKSGFLKKLSLKFKDPENTTLFILDKFDGNSELVAELVTINGFKAAYGIKDGVEGPRGWVNSGLPWTQPRKAPSLDLGNLAEALGEVIGEGSDGLAVTLGIAAATGLGLLAFTEVETILQLLGSAALVQLVSKKLLFAEDRKLTLQQADEFLNTKIAPKELVAEIQEIGKAFLPSTVNGKALPAPAPNVDSSNKAESAAESKAESAAEPKAEAPAEPKVEAPAEPKVEAPAEPKAEAAAEPKAEAAAEPKIEAAAEPKAKAAVESKAEAAVEPAPEINSVPKTEVKQESHAGFSKALSPFPYYPDFKPPASPTPSKP